MKYQFPDEDTLGKYHALLRAVLVEARWLSYSPSNHKRVAELMDAVENLPDLLCRWPDMKEDWILSELEAHERKYYEGVPQFTRIIREGPRDDWQLNRTSAAG
jgi:hypothetical protein